MKNNTFKYAVGIFSMLLLALFPTIKLNASNDTVYNSIDISQLSKIMNSLNYDIDLETSKSGNEIIAWKINNMKIFMFIDSTGESLQFYSYVRASGTRRELLDKINEWNKSKRFSRSYLDKEGDPVLELDLSLTGGVTEEAIKNFLLFCRYSHRGWLKAVN